MAVESKLKPNRKHIASEINDRTTTQSDDSNRSESTRLEFKLTYKKEIKKTDKDEQYAYQKAQELERNKHITQNFRHFLFLFKELQLQKTAPALTPLQIQLLNLRNGKPLTFEALKMLLIHYTRLGKDIHGIDRLAMENPETAPTPSPHFK